MAKTCHYCDKYPAKSVFFYTEKNQSYIIYSCGKCIRKLERGELPARLIKSEIKLPIANGIFPVGDVDTVLYYHKDKLRKIAPLKGFPLERFITAIKTDRFSSGNGKREKLADEKRNVKGKRFKLPWET